jgi:hypothetical protein
MVVLVIKLDNRARQLGTFLDAEALRQRSRRHIPHHHLQRHNLNFANQLFAHVEAADEVGRHPDIVEVLKQVLRDPVVEDALALDHLVFLGVERGRIVLEVLDQGSRLRSLVKDLGLAFINAAPTAHWDVPCIVEIHEFGVLRMTRDNDPRRSCREGQGRETEREPGLRSNLSDWPDEHNRPGPLQGQFYRAACGFEAVVLTLRSSYLGAQDGCRNEAAIIISAAIGTPK